MSTLRLVNLQCENFIRNNLKMVRLGKIRRDPSKVLVRNTFVTTNLYHFSGFMVHLNLLMSDKQKNNARISRQTINMSISTHIDFLDKRNQVIMKEAFWSCSNQGKLFLKSCTKNGLCQKYSSFNSLENHYIEKS